MPDRAKLQGKAVVAHPSCAAQADQVAAEHDVRDVRLSSFCPPWQAYIVDLDYLSRFSDDFGIKKRR